MPSESPEPENYTISQMMDRLKERSSGDPSAGELVTRSDGTQAIKVRKRKRRSEQVERDRQKRSKRLRAIQLVSILLVLLLGLLVAGGVLLYYNGGPYRNKILQRITDASGASAEVAQFRVTPLGATAQSLSMKWPEKSVLKSLSLKGVSAELRASSLLGQTWSGDELTASSGELLIGEPIPDGGPIVADEGEGRFRFTRFRSPDMTVIVGNPQSPVLAIRESELSFYPQALNGRAELRLTRGAVSFRSGLPALNLDRGFFGFSGRQMEVLSLRLEDPTDSRGLIELSGSVSPFSKNKVSTLDIKKVENFPLEHLVGQEFGRILSGRIESRDLPNSNFLSFSSGSIESARLMMAFRGGFSSKLTLANLPFLTALARMLDDSGYERPSIDSGASGVLRISPTGYSIEDLRLEAKSRMIVRGSLSVTQGKVLAGRLEVGLPPNQIATLLRSLDSEFSAPREEMRWMEIEVSGTTTAPVDDFSKKLMRKSSGQSSEPSSQQPSPRSLFEEATKPR